MHVLVATRIFAPEPAAASFRLAALVRAIDAAGAAVTVLTTRAPGGATAPAIGRAVVRRWPVLRDADGYVRGYVQYMSFDVPVFLRILLARRVDVVVSEPPPTTGFAVRLACALRRVPYVYYAADIWSDAAGTTGAPGAVVRVLRSVERWVWRGASAILSVSSGVTTRLSELGVANTVHEIGNGIDTAAFAADGQRAVLADGDGGSLPYFVYAGTASEWHGAGIFAEAMLSVHASHPRARLVFVGQGAEKGDIERACSSLPDGVVTFLPRAPAEEVAVWFRGAVASLASVRPGRGYDFSFPTKVYASLACGTPAIYAGVGPARDLLVEHGLGRAVDYDAAAVAAAMVAALEEHGGTVEGTDVPAARGSHHAAWARSSASLTAVAARGSAVVLAATR